jgi:hypothetical protein
MIIRRVATVVPAEGVILERVLDATYTVSNGGLSRHPYGTLDAAQMSTVWGRGHRRRFALVDGADVLASAAPYDLARSSINGRCAFAESARFSVSPRTAALAMRRSWSIDCSTKLRATELSWRSCSQKADRNIWS